MMIAKAIARYLYDFRWKSFSKELIYINENSFLCLDEQKRKQFEDLKKILSFAFDNVEYYRDYKEKYLPDFQEAGSIEDVLPKLPVIDKEIINNAKTDFFSKKRDYIVKSTGGSTGTPLSFRLDKESLAYSRLLMYRGYCYAGYTLGDPLLVFGGGSLVKESNFLTSLKTALINTKKVSSYGIDEKELFSLYKYINRKKNLFILGYVSSVYFLALYIQNNNLEVISPPKAIFTTAEVLSEQQRTIIESAFKTKVFDNYGINDGGASARECNCHDGMHLDMERSIIEVVDESGCSIEEGVGKIIVTSLNNFSMPFIRYDTGDYGKITSEKCKCGRETPRILEIIGRTTDYLKFGSVYLGSPVLTVLMGKLDMDLYQIIQLSENKVKIKILKAEGLNEDYKNKTMAYIDNSFKTKVPDIEIEYLFFDDFAAMGIKNKHKIIINECSG